MEPTLYTGDLAVVRRQSQYEVGDVVAFRVDGGAVIHRIVGGDSNSGFVMQGDNNPQIDGWRPVASDISGTMWFHMPEAGTWLARLRSPRNLNLLGAVAVALIVPLGGSQALGRRTRRKRMNAHDDANARPTPGGLGSMPPLPPWLLAPLILTVVVALVFGAAAFGAFRESATHPEFVERLVYEHQGEFSYVVETAPSRLYPGGRVVPIETDDGAVTSQPIYTSLARTMNVSFDYIFSTEAATNLNGELSLELEVRADGGWTQRPLSTAPVPFDGTTASSDLRIDFAAIRGLIEAIETETGVKSARYDLVVTPTVRLGGTVDEEPVTEAFTPAFTISLTDTLIAPEGALGRAEPIRLGETRDIANQHSFLGLSMSVSTWRTVAAASGIAVLMATGALAAVWLTGLGRDEDGKIEARYHSMLLRVLPGRDGPPGKLTRVATMHDLARLAKRDGGIIFAEQRTRGRRYFVRDGDDTYEYVTSAVLAAEARPFSDLSELAQGRS